MKTATKGNEAEAMILAALIERGFEVSVPFGSGQPYDVVVDLGGFDLLKPTSRRAFGSLRTMR